MEVVKDNIDKLEGIPVGTEVTCKIDIRGRLYEGNYYNNILAWAVNTGTFTKSEDKVVEVGADDNDLPF